MASDDINPPIRLVRCPRCRRSARYDLHNASRPFCSPLCKSEDIAAWAEQDYRIPGPLILDPEAMPPAATEEED